MTPSIRTRTSGISIVEVLIMAVILGACALGLGQAMMGSMHQTRLADEMRAASFAARAKLEAVLAGTIAEIETTYGPARPQQAFEVRLSEEPIVILPGVGVAGDKAGEVVLLNDESLGMADVGRDLDGSGGADGVSMAPWPMDIDGNPMGSGGTKKRIVVGVLIRWITFAGHEQRYELWSVR